MATNPLTTIRIATGDNHPVWADLYCPQGVGGPGVGGLETVVVLCHGLKGYRRWGFIPRLGETLRSAGLGAMAIDFSHNGAAGGDGGDSGGPVYPQPDLFRRNTLDRERRDLAAVIQWIRNGGEGWTRPDARLGLWGHSRGGGAVLLNALADPGGASAIATWSAPAHSDIYTPRQKARWREAGEFEFLESVSGERLAMGVCFVDDLEARHADYALAQRAATLAVPHLVVHGEMDLVISVESAEQFCAAGHPGAEKKLVRLRTGHTYGIGRSDDTKPLREAIDVTVDWFRRYLLKTGDDE